MKEKLRLFLSVLRTVETGTGTLSLEKGSAQMEKAPSELDVMCQDVVYTDYA